MSARKTVYVIKDVPCDGGESPNAYVPRITAEVLLNFPPNTASQSEVTQALEDAYGEALFKAYEFFEERAASLGRYRVGDLVRYVGGDPRWAGQQGLVARADYENHPAVPLVVDLPGGPKGIGVCFTSESVERVSPPGGGEE